MTTDRDSLRALMDRMKPERPYKVRKVDWRETALRFKRGWAELFDARTEALGALGALNSKSTKAEMWAAIKKAKGALQ